MRQKVMERLRNSASATLKDRKGKSNSNGVTPGAFVCMKNAPIFHAGAVGFTVINGEPKDAWKLTDVCRFRVRPFDKNGITLNRENIGQHGSISYGKNQTLNEHFSTCIHAISVLGNHQQQPETNVNTVYNSSSAVPSPAASTNTVEPSQSAASHPSTIIEMPPPPSPASSTCSEQSGPVKVSPGTFKRKKGPSTSNDKDKYLSGLSTNDWVDIFGLSSNNQSSSSQSRSARGRSIDREMNSCTVNKESYKRPASVSNVPVISQASVKPPYEEDWALSKVVFVEDGRTQPVGIVLKIDGNIAAVKFVKENDRACLAVNCPYSPVCSLLQNIIGSNNALPQPQASANIQNVSTPPSPGANNNARQMFNPSSLNFNQAASLSDSMSWLNDCRLLCKDDLSIVHNASSPRVPDFLQRSPKCILPATNKFAILSAAVECDKIHCVVSKTKNLKNSRLKYVTYDLRGSEISSLSMPLTGRSLVSSSNSKLQASFSFPSQFPMVLRVSENLLFPFVPPPNEENSPRSVWPTPEWTDLPPISSISMGWQVEGKKIDKTLSGSDGKQALSSIGHYSNRMMIGVVVVKDMLLMPSILRADDENINELLNGETPLSQPEVFSIMNERIDGHRNILHAAVSMCAPISNKEVEWKAKLKSALQQNILPKSKSANKDQDSKSSVSFFFLPSRSQPSSSVNMHDFFIKSSDLASASSNRVSAQSNAPSGYFWHQKPIKEDAQSRRIASYRTLKLLVQSPTIRPYLKKLLSEKNSEGYTPFRLAIQCRAYLIAEYLLEITEEMNSFATVKVETVEKEEQKSIPPLDKASEEFLYPNEFIYSADDDTHFGITDYDSPLFSLCHNDTCSFTWTGPDHTRQDIFECRTCGLTDSLCCCTECARVCHKGHDCRLKRTSPTAYCDCWEKCRCKSLISGVQAARHSIFYKLLMKSDLVKKKNYKDEHLLLFLAKCVERQSREQKQFRISHRRSSSRKLSSNQNNAEASSTANKSTHSRPGPGEQPEHDLDPPRFAKDALALCLDSVKAITSFFIDSSCEKPSAEENAKQTNHQSSCIQIDEFVFLLVCKCPSELVDILIRTFKREFSYLDSNSDPSLGHFFGTKPDENSKVHELYVAARRFIRSVARMYVSLKLELNPDYANRGSNMFGSLQSNALSAFKDIFLSMPIISLIELPQLANDLMGPVQCGVVKPSVSFYTVSQINDATNLLVNECTSYNHNRFSKKYDKFVRSSMNAKTAKKSIGNDESRGRDKSSSKQKGTDTYGRSVGAGRLRKYLSHRTNDSRYGNKKRRNNRRSNHKRDRRYPYDDDDDSLDNQVENVQMQSSRDKQRDRHNVHFTEHGENSRSRALEIFLQGHSQGSSRPLNYNLQPLSYTVTDSPVLLQNEGGEEIVDNITGHIRTIEETSDSEEPTDPQTVYTETTRNKSKRQSVKRKRSFDWESSASGQKRSRKSTSFTAQRGLSRSRRKRLFQKDHSHFNEGILTGDEGNSLSEEDNLRVRCEAVNSEQEKNQQTSEPNSNEAGVSGASSSIVSLLQSSRDGRQSRLGRPLESKLSGDNESSGEDTVDEINDASSDESNPENHFIMKADDEEIEDGERYKYRKKGKRSFRESTQQSGTLPFTDDDEEEVQVLSVEDSDHDTEEILHDYREILGMESVDSSEEDSVDYIDNEDQDCYGGDDFSNSDDSSFSECGDSNDEEDIVSATSNSDEAEENPDDCDEDAENTLGNTVPQYYSERDDQEQTGNDRRSWVAISKSSANGDPDFVDDPRDNEGRNSGSRRYRNRDKKAVGKKSSKSGRPNFSDDDGSRRNNDAISPVRFPRVSNNKKNSKSGSYKPLDIPIGNRNSSRRFKRRRHRAIRDREDQSPESIRSFIISEAASDGDDANATDEEICDITHSDDNDLGEFENHVGTGTEEEEVVELPDDEDAATDGGQEGENVLPMMFLDDQSRVATGSTVSHDGNQPSSSTAGSSSNHFGNHNSSISQTQNHLSRASSFILRLIGDIMIELRQRTHENAVQSTVIPDTGSTTSALLRRCISVPSLLNPSPARCESVYEQQCQYIYSNNASSNSNNTYGTPISSSTRAPSQSGILTVFYFKQHMPPANTPLPSLPPVPTRKLTREEEAVINSYIGSVLSPLWFWLASVMDPLESQLRFTASKVDQNEPNGNGDIHPINSQSIINLLSGKKENDSHRRSHATEEGSVSKHRSGGNTSSDPNIAGSSRDERSYLSSSKCRQDFLSYMLSIMRTSSSEHGDNIPSIDLKSFKHIAYIIDAFLYLLKSYEHLWPSGMEQFVEGFLRSNLTQLADAKVEVMDTSTNEKDELNSLRLTKRTHVYFRRSESILSLSGPGLDLISNPLSQSIPLATRPGLLHPEATRVELFGSPREFMQSEEITSDGHMALGVSSRNNWCSELDKCVENSDKNTNWLKTKAGMLLLDSIGHSGTVLSRWCTSLEIFSNLFSEDVGSEEKSYMRESSHFHNKERRFRAEMERLRSASRRDLNLLVDRQRDVLLLSTTHKLNQEVFKRNLDSPHQSPPLCSNRIKIAFNNEPAQGSGVMRAFFTSFAEAVLLEESLPKLDLLMDAVPPEITSTSSSATSSLSRSGALANQGLPLYRSSLNLPRSLSGEGFVVSRPTRNNLYSIASINPQQIRSLGSVYSTASSRVHFSTDSYISRFSLNAPPYVPPSTRSLSTSSNLQSAAEIMAGVSSRTSTTTAYSPTRVTSASTSGGSNFTNGVPPRLAHAMYNRVLSITNQEELSSRICGMLLELPGVDIINIASAEVDLQRAVADARALIEREASSSQSSRLPTSTPMVITTPSRNSLSSTQAVPTPVVPSIILNRVSAPPKTTVTNTSFSGEGMNMSTSSDGPSKSSVNSLTDPDNPDLAPLFWQPNIHGYYSPRATRIPNNDIQSNKNYEARLLIYRTIGRVIGLVLLSNETIPLKFNRHVLSFICGHNLHWHDFAFYDHVLFENLRHMLDVTDKQDPSDTSIEDYGLCFSICLREEEAAQTASKTPNVLPVLHNLIPNGDQVLVSRDNVFEYVKRYTEFKMYDVIKEPLEQMKNGIYDVLPPNSLDGLTPEDLRLLLNGSSVIDIDKLISYTKFQDESSLSSEKGSSNVNDDKNNADSKIEYLKYWFWSVVRGMDDKQRQNLLYFWTSSPTLPATSQGFQPMPTITIRPADDHHFPTANTCISRLYLPLYSKRSILKEKLCYAIQTKGFGFV